MRQQLVFLDLDDTILTGPYNAIKKAAFLFGIHKFPPEEEFLNRKHIHYYRSHPHIFKNPSYMWKLGLAALPLGYVKSQHIFKEIDISKLTAILSDERVFVITQNPPFLSSARIKHLERLTGVNLGLRYLPCGPIKGFAPSKAMIMKEIAVLNGINPGDCLLIDDSISNITEAKELGMTVKLVRTSWMGDVREFEIIDRKDITNICSDFLKEKDHDNASSDIKPAVVIPIGFLSNAISLGFVRGKILRRFNLPKKTSIDYYSPMRFSSIKKSRLFLWTPWNFAIPITSQNTHKEIVLSLERLGGNNYISPPSYLRWTEKYSRKELIAEVLKLDLGDKNTVLKYAKEMYSNRSPLGVFGAGIFASLLMKLFFRHVYIKKSRDLRDLERRAFVIYLPLHRSILDSPFLMYVTKKHGLTLPIIPAADKMRKNFAGVFGNFIGTFYIQRKNVDETYSKVMDYFIEMSVRHSSSTAIFLEGQRSRSGKTLPPKTGILRSFIQHAVKYQKEIALVPISFGYNKLPEAESILDEVIDNYAKEEELTADLQSDILIYEHATKRKWQNGGVFLNLFKKKISDAYMSFGDPIMLSIGADSDPRKILKQNVKQIMIASNMCVPPIATSLACLAVIYTKTGCIAVKDLLRFLGFSSLILKINKEGLYNDVQGRNNHDFLEELNKLPFLNRKFKNSRIHQQDIVSITEIDRFLASHYSNNMLHYFAKAAYLARLLSVRRKGNMDSLYGEFSRGITRVLNDFSIPSHSKDEYERLMYIFAIFGALEISGNDFLFLPKVSNSPFEILENLSEVVLGKEYDIGVNAFHRKEPRLEVSIPVWVTIPDQTVEGRISNLSQSGGAVLTPLKVIESDKIEISFSGASKGSAAKVVRLMENGFAFQFETNEATNVSHELRKVA